MGGVLLAVACVHTYAHENHAVVEPVNEIVEPQVGRREVLVRPAAKCLRVRARDRPTDRPMS